jgi:hypothetical protein
MGRDVVDAESRMGLPDEATLAREFARARRKARLRNGWRRLKAALPALSPP